MPNGATASGIGDRLREARLDRGQSIEEIAWRTRMRPEYLRALEEERFDGLGHPSFVRTHLRTYAGVLGLDAAAVEEEFRRSHQPAEPSSLATLHRRQREGRKQRPKLSWRRAAVVAAAALAAAAAGGVLRGPGSGEPPAAAPAAARLDGPAQASRDDRSGGPVRVAGAAVAPASVRLELAAVDRVWVRVTGDGMVLFEGMLEGGASRLFTAAGRIDLLTDSFERLRLEAAGKPFRPAVRGRWSGSFGRQGPVASR